VGTARGVRKKIGIQFPRTEIVDIDATTFQEPLKKLAEVLFTVKDLYRQRDEQLMKDKGI
jgi:hypothetical protein